DEHVRRGLWSEAFGRPDTRQILDLVRRGVIGPADPMHATLMAEYPLEWDTWFAAVGDRPTLDNVMPSAGASSQWTQAQIAWANHWRVIDPQTAGRWRDYSRAVALGWSPPTPFNPSNVIPADVIRATQAADVRPEFRPSAVIDTYQQIGFRHLIQLAEYLG